MDSIIISWVVISNKVAASTYQPVTFSACGCPSTREHLIGVRNKLKHQNIRSFNF